MFLIVWKNIDGKQRNRLMPFLNYVNAKRAMKAFREPIGGELFDPSKGVWKS